MTPGELVGKAQTVLGVIDVESLGVTLPHEHLLTDLRAYFVEPTEAGERKLAHEPVSLENLCWIRNHHQSNLDDLDLTDEHLITKEVMLYKLAGGNTIVEMSSIGLARDPLGLARIARATGLNVVMGSGYYVGLSHPPDLATMTDEEIAEGIVRDIMVGVGDTGVRAGMIGEIGCSIPLEEKERKVLRAGAIAQQRTGAPLNIHPSGTDDLVLEIVKILDDAGADLSRTVISHVDFFGFSRATLHKLADAGCYIEYDTFGHYHAGFMQIYFGRVIDLGSGVRRIDDIMQLIADGYLNQLLVSSDVCLKHVLVSYGGCGYANILQNVVPFMRYRGMSDEQIHTLMVENPKRLLAFSPVKS